MRDGDTPINMLHTVTRCDLDAPVLDCSSIGVLGHESRNFYVSSHAVYLWLTGSDARDRPSSMLMRLPFDRGPPTASATRGAPVDQFSFHEDEGAGRLDVLVRAEGGGEGMWGAEVSDEDVALLQLPLGEMGDGSRQVPSSRYRPLPRPSPDSWSFQNRFVGHWLLYSATPGREEEGSPAGRLFAAPLGGGPTIALALSHRVDRIEPMGEDAIAIGSRRSSLGFSTVALDGTPRLADVYANADSAEGESRSHGFFFRADPDSRDGRSGLIGLPVARPAQPGFQRFFGSAAAMLFLRRDARVLHPAGELAARQSGVRDDGCRASCVDWYGNARPIFANGRVFALLGYELVEGQMRDGRILEIGRADFTPADRRRG